MVTTRAIKDANVRFSNLGQAGVNMNLREESVEFPTCFICDKMTTDMHQLRHRKDNGQYLRFGPVPSPHEPIVFAMTGVNLNVNTSGEFNTGIPMCSTCFAARQREPRDHFSPEVHEVECRVAKAIMHRQWKKGLSWGVCTIVYPEEKPCGPSFQ